MDLNNVFVCDCETDGFLDEATKIHTFGVGWKNKEGEWQIKDTGDYENMKKVLCNPNNTCVFHNGYLFDKPVMEKLLGVKIEAKIIDTLPLAWQLFPNRIKEGKRYGLESFGETYGFPKPKITSWTDLTYEEYAHRVREDVKINIALWEDCLSYLIELYEDNLGMVPSFINFLDEIMDICAEQERIGIKLDHKLCEKNLEILTKQADEKVEILKGIMPKVPKEKLVKKPKTIFKKEGTLSVAGEKWLTLLKNLKLPEDYSGDINTIVGYEDPNPVSVRQMKDYLFSLGWEPKIFVDSVSVTGEVKKVEQVKDKEKNLCKSVLKLVEKVPNLIALDDLSLINHRASYLKGFLSNVQSNGYIQAQINGLTNTCRLRHKTLVNLIKPSAPYGEYIRSVLTCNDDEVFIGSDLSSLENYTRTHFISEIQPEAVDILSDKSYDSHTQLAIFAGMMSQEDEDFYKWYKKEGRVLEDLPEKYQNFSEEALSEEFGRLNAIRSKAKTTSYSALYGVGKRKLAEELKIPVKEAEQLLEGYWKLNFAVKEFAQSCKIKEVRGQKWVLNPGNNFWYSLRSEKDVFSTVNQSFGSFIHILWCKNIRKMGVEICGNFHDEILVVVKDTKCDIVKEVLQKAIDLTNKQAKLKVPIKIDIQVGKNYGEVH